MIYNSLNFAQNFLKIDFEIMLASDSPNLESENTIRNILKRYNNIVVHNFSHRDVGLVRRDMVKKCKFDIIFFVDADDFWSSNWIYNVLKKINKTKKEILHPEITYFISNKSARVFKNQKVSESNFSKYYLLFENIWSSSFAASKAIFEDLNFKQGSVNSNSGIFAFEDWTFFRDSLFLGIKHKIIEESFHIHRVKDKSNTNLSKFKFPHPRF